ncbi:MAG TPA: carbohydrate-binding protein [Verrucomicrobiota bacterium]|nr:carbohydrate-binding protein [Verrucomicrobiota bacterium]
MNAVLSLSLVVPALLLGLHAARAAESHVAMHGHDANPGTKASPLRSIQRAANLAQPGDTITVHEGVYRERVNPPRGGASDKERIVYRAAPGERVEIKGSEIVKNWVRVQDDVWKVSLTNAYFGGFNPYDDPIRGDWFDPRGRPHHTGAVYLDGEWLTEAAQFEDVMLPAGTTPAWMSGGDPDYLLNVAWLRPGKGSGSEGRIPATSFAAKQGTQNAACEEGGDCIGWIAHGHWVRYDAIDFGSRTEQIELRAASATDGGLIEIRLGAPDGEVLGVCPIPNTGGWQTWSSFHAAIKPLSGVRSVCLVFKSRKPGASMPRPINPQLWFARVSETETTLWAQFKGVNPNERCVEINVRRTVFYPDKPGRNFITVRGFALRQAATPWAPPTAEQVGLIGTHWSKGWVIEDNTVSHSTCSGIALGKYGDQYDNTSANTAEGYVKTIERALANGWNKATIGHHVVRRNTISHCEQAGIVGSLGAAFSTVSDNTIHDIHVRRLFSGAEMAGIKFHAAIDCVIQRNHIHRTCLGLWLDWMAQGTRVSGNLFHENAGQDLFVEVNHGPFLVDNNLFLSTVSLLDMSEGGAYAHNLFGGRIVSRPEPSRETPYHPAHTTEVAGVANIKGGDNRFHNNILVGNGPASASEGVSPRKDPEWRGGYGLWMYDSREFPLRTGGNVYYHGARPYAQEANPVVREKHNPQVSLAQRDGHYFLDLTVGRELRDANTAPVSTALLGRAKIPGLAYENPDSSPLEVDKDYFGKARNRRNPTPGPFERPGVGTLTLQVR